MEQAVVVLRKQGAKSAEKKSDRTLGAGTVASYIHAGGNVGSMVELSCETDFVSKNEDFQKLAYDIAMHVAALNPEYLKIEDVPEEAKTKVKEVFEKEVEGKPEEMKEKILSGKLDAYFKEKALLSQPFVKNPELTIHDLVQGAIQKFGEKTELTRFVRFSTSG